MRANDIFLRSGEKEMDIINLINKNVYKFIFNNSKDPNDRRHIIRLLDHFEYRKHLCIVFE